MTQLRASFKAAMAVSTATVLLVVSAAPLRADESWYAPGYMLNQASAASPPEATDFAALIAQAVHTEPITAGATPGAVAQTQFAEPAPPVISTPLVAPAPGAVVEPPLTGFPTAPPTGPPYVLPMAPPLPRVFLGLDALGWWVKGDNLPPLVTSSPVGTPQTDAGVLGLPTTTILFGDEAVNDNIRPGGRVAGGIWIDRAQTFAAEGHYYQLATQTTTFSRTSIFSDGTTDDFILARPFFNITPGFEGEDAILVAFPDFIVPPSIDIDGSIQVQESSRIVSAGGGGRYSLNSASAAGRLYAIGAYRYFRLAEDLSIVAASAPETVLFPIPFPTDRIEVVDSFSTRNTFNGGEVGLGLDIGGITRWSLGVETRLAMGNMYQTLAIDGRTSAIASGFVASFPGGLLAMPTNIGSYERNVFSLIPSVDVKLGFQVLPAMRVTVGYNFTYVTNVLRPGSEVDTTVNLSQVAGLPLIGPARPEVQFNDTDIWLQGITAGLDFRF